MVYTIHHVSADRMECSNFVFGTKKDAMKKAKEIATLFGDTRKVVYLKLSVSSKSYWHYDSEEYVVVQQEVYFSNGA